jgi:hypothetical protein
MLDLNRHAPAPTSLLLDQLLSVADSYDAARAALHDELRLSEPDS